MFFRDDVRTQADTFIADKDVRPGNQLFDFMLAFAAKRTVQRSFLSSLDGVLVIVVKILFCSLPCYLVAPAKAISY
jgi:hypothetical protein